MTTENDKSIRQWGDWPPRNRPGNCHEDDYVETHDEFMGTWQDIRKEAVSPGLPVERMRELVSAAFDDGGFETSLEIMLAVDVAKCVLSRPDCPYELLLLVATHPEWESRLSGNILANTVLKRPDCPEDIIVAAALKGFTVSPEDPHGNYLDALFSGDPAFEESGGDTSMLGASRVF